MNIAKNFNVNINLGPVALNILQQFAEHKQLSVWQIHSVLERMNYEMAYKNVFIRVKRLFSLHLIEEVKLIENNTGHGAKYYRLTEEGIFYLLLNIPLSALIVDQLSVNTSSPRFVNIYNFIQYYQDSELFRSFLYPFFEEKTILADNRSLLGELLAYLYNCCKEIEKWLKRRNIPTYLYSFYWNSAPDTYNDTLVSLLRETFELKDKLEYPRIERIDEKTIRIASLRNTINIKLDLKRKKAIAVLEENGKREEYPILYLGGSTDYLVTGGKSSSFTPDSFQNSINDALKTLVSKLIFTIANNESKEWKHVQEIISHDKKFHRLGHDMFKELMRGCKKLGLDDHASSC